MKTIYAEKNILRMLLTQLLVPVWPGVVWSPLSHATVAEIPDPPLPGPRWLRARNRQCGLDATDLTFIYLKGVNTATAPVALPGNYRFYLGHEVVSDVVEVGPGVTRFKPGDRVVMRFNLPSCFRKEIDPPCRFCVEGQIALCENASVNQGGEGVGGGWSDGYVAHEMDVLPVAAGLTDDQASLVEPSAVALHGVLRRPPQAGDHVLVIGAGIIGLLVAQAVKAVQPACHLTVLARYPHQAEAAQRLGANVVVHERDNLYQEMARITGAKYYSAPLNKGMLLGGFDVIYDCVGSAETVTDSLRWARARGTVVMLGISFDFQRVDLTPVWYQEVDFIGSYVYGVDELNGVLKDTFFHAMDLFKAGKLTDEGLITHRFPLAEYKRAIATSVSKAAEKPIKVMFDLK